MDRFAELLYDLSKIWSVELFPDKKNFCRFSHRGDLHIQLEFEEAKQRILIASFLCEVPPGKYRENILKEALKANFIYPRVGILAYSERNNKLILFDYVYPIGHFSDKFAKILENFIEKAHEWKVAIEKGAPLPTAGTGKNQGLLFGLKT